MSVVPTLHLTLRDEAVERLVAGTSVDVQGVPGSGRSQLLRAVADELDDRGLRIIRMRGIEALADRPLEPLAIAGLVGRRDAARASTSIAAAVAAIAAAVRDGRTVLVVDDVDALDEATGGALTAAHAEHPFAMLSASTARPRSARSAHPVPVGIQPGVTLPVPALGYIDTQTLLAGLLEGPIDAQVVTRVFTASGGLPGVALAIVDGARRSGALAQSDGVWTAGPDMWTAGLERTLEPFLRPLTPEALEGLHALAIAGTTDARTARELMGWEAMEELDGYQLVRFVPRGSDVMVGVFPPVLAERFAQNGIGSRQLKVSERVDAAIAPPVPYAPVPAGARPYAGVPDPIAEAVDASPPGVTAEPVINRMLLDHWFQLAAQRRSEWEADPRPRTGEALLRTILVTDPDPDAVREVVQRTSRTGDRRAVVDFDAWTAIATGVVEQDLGRVRTLLDLSRAEFPEWGSFLDAVELHLTLLLDHIPDLAADDHPGAHAAPEVAVAWSVVRAEQLVARGRSAEALALLEGSAGDDSPFARIGSGVRGIALVLDGRFDEAMEWASTRLTSARAVGDVDGIVAHAYTIAIVLLLRLRVSELRVLTASVLSTGVLSALQRPAEAGLIAIAAALAFEEGNAATARNLVAQAAAVTHGPGWYPVVSSNYTLARLDGHDPAALDAVWSEYRELLRRGCTFAGLVTGVLVVAEQPDPQRAAELVALARTMPAPAARWLQTFLESMLADDPEEARRDADALADADVHYLAMRAYRHTIERFSERGAAARVASVAAAARTRLEAVGREAVAALGRSAARSLTDRELEIARLAADGMPNQQIADRLHLSIRTVENHLHRAFRKLGVDSRAALAEALAV